MLLKCYKSNLRIGNQQVLDRSQLLLKLNIHIVYQKLILNLCKPFVSLISSSLLYLIILETKPFV